MVNMSSICYIVGAGEYIPLDFIKNEDDFVIACDGGLKYLKEYKIIPDLILGDFDSLGYVPQGKNVIKLNPVKDDTDVVAAIRIAEKKGYKDYRFYCCTGGAISHTLANIQCLIRLSKAGLRGYLFDKTETITAVTDGELSFNAASGFVSVFAADKFSFGVTLKGMKYPLTNYSMRNVYPIGVSNEFYADKSTVSVKKGTLIVVFPSNTDLPRFTPFSF